MLTVSFCVPVFNRADRIRRCIESMITQTAPSDSYEIIVVDDHSTDGTADAVQAIFDEHGFANGRVHILDQNSGGASAPRNAAADMARGEYLFFVDSDDYVLPGLVEKIRWCADEFGSDIVYPRYRRETETGEVTSKPHAFARHGDIGRADVLQHHMLYAMSVLKAFKRSEWERLGIRFDTSLRTGEDVLVTAQFLFNTSVHTIVADQVYYAIVDHEQARLTQKPTVRAATFANYGRILDIIYAGTLGDSEFKNRAAAAFINRIMRTGSGANNAFLDPSVSPKSQAQWRTLFQTLLNDHLPVAADRYLDPLYADKVACLRQGDLAGARFAVEMYELKQLREDLYYGALLQLRAAESAAAIEAANGLEDATGPDVAASDTDTSDPGALRVQLKAAQARLKVAQAKLRASRAQVEVGQEQLRISQAQAKAAQARLREVYGSTSWRVTAPLRRASALAKKARRAARDPRAAVAAVAWRASQRHPSGPYVADLRLDPDGRPEVLLGGLPTSGTCAVFADVEPSGHRDARHRLPIVEVAGGTLVARLPVPASVGASQVRLTVEHGAETSRVQTPRRRHIATRELRATTTADAVQIDRIRAATPWQPTDDRPPAR